MMATRRGTVELMKVDAVAGPRVGLDMGTFAVKGVLIEEGAVRRARVPTAGRPLEAARDCLARLGVGSVPDTVLLGITGANADLLAREVGLHSMLELEALVTGMEASGLTARGVLSLGHENMSYLELGEDGRAVFFNRNGQCAAGSGAFWYQQATRMGFDDRELADLALQADGPVRISGRCAIFAKSDMTHAINEGATQAAVSAGLARALAEMVANSVAQNRLGALDRVLVVGGVANNQAVLRYLGQCTNGARLEIPPEHEFLVALGAALRGEPARLAALDFEAVLGRKYVPGHRLPPLEPGKVRYLPDLAGAKAGLDTGIVYLGVDCGSVSTKCVLLDGQGSYIGGVYLPTSGRPALQVLELMKEVQARHGELLRGAPVVACTTGSGRFLSQKMLGAEYAVDEISCQAEGVRYLCGDSERLSIIEIGGEDSKFLQLDGGALHDYNMNPVCAAGTGSFLENLAGLLGISIKDEFSQRAFGAPYAIDLGDTCTLLSQSALAAAASQGLPLSSQLASLAYSSARNYLRKTAENRSIDGRVVFTGATAKNHALASAFAHELGGEVVVPPSPELSGALGAALVAQRFHREGRAGDYRFPGLGRLNRFGLEKRRCRARCEHEHQCTLDLVRFADGKTVIYGDRCGRYSGIEEKRSLRYSDLPELGTGWRELFYRVPRVEGGPTVGLAQAGLFYDLYPFWAAFFAELGATVVLSSESSDRHLRDGKRYLDTEMCCPMEVLVGHYQELLEQDLDWVFLPEVVDLESPPWARGWPKGFSCPLLQTVRGTVVGALDPPTGRLLHAQLNYRRGPKVIRNQLRPVARQVLGEAFREELFRRAVEAGYRELERFELALEREAQRLMEELPVWVRDDTAVCVMLGRSYTTYDRYVAKRSLEYARQAGIIGIPQDYLLAYTRAWYEGRLGPELLGPRDEFDREFGEFLEKVNHIYPAQVQRMLSAAFIARYLNQRAERTGLPLFHAVLQDPFKCGPNAMLRHYLAMVCPSLRLTMDEHTAPAGMLTRLEAFKNTCRSRRNYRPPEIISSRPLALKELERRTLLVAEPVHHVRAFVAMFQNYGVAAEILPRSPDPDLFLAKRYVNGEECLPLIQNVQDFLDYLKDGHDPDRLAFAQGWACGPCRYGMYATTQSLLLNRAGYGPGRVLWLRLEEAIGALGFGFAVGLYDGLLAMDALYKLLLATRPYELQAGAAQTLFDDYSDELLQLLKRFRVSAPALLAGTHLRPFEELVARAAGRFAAVPRSGEVRPRVVVGGEFYVRLDDRSNQDLFSKVEAAGGEVLLSPVTELFAFSAYVGQEEATAHYRDNPELGLLAKRLGYGALHRLARRDEARITAASGVLHEPSPEELRELSRPYISGHYGGEPPMTVGRACALARSGEADGVIFVAPFNCMPGSMVEAQLTALRRDLGVPIVALYYDGTGNPNREEFIRSLVYQARAVMESRRHSPAPRR
ncbi:MAG TPA: hypothetical protein DCM14_06470 [Clostridiales bacterium UBA8153]|nr:hypothetical protein [Clostridiales bacterium UBA8153]